MSARRWFPLMLCLVLAACAGQARETAAARDDEASARQLLVMLRLPAAHFRADAPYAPDYGATGHEARRRVADALARQYGLTIVDDWPMPSIGVDCFVMQATGQAPLAPLVEHLSADPRVESAQQVNLFDVLGDSDPLYALQPSAMQWHLSDLHKMTTGKRVRVAQVDSGVELDHPDLAGQVALARNFVTGRPEAGEMHGTAVAGIIAARADNGIGIAGIAPDATFIALRACWENPGRSATATCSSFTLAKALQFALDERADVINLSVGGPRDVLLARLLDVALSRDITVVAAVDPNASDGGFPASHGGVLGITADGMQRGNGSGKFLAAPGREIPTTLPGHKWGMVSGSSFAAAHVTGLVALLLQLSPKVQPQQLRSVLAYREVPALATDAIAEKPILVDACAAVARTAGTCACACAAGRRASLQNP